MASKMAAKTLQILKKSQNRQFIVDLLLSNLVLYIIEAIETIYSYKKVVQGLQIKCNLTYMNFDV